MICPWSALSPATLSFCEAQQCSWIAEPGNTWTNLFLVLLGIWILRREKLRHLRVIGYAAFMTGVCSTFYHASHTLIGQFADFSAMFLFSSALISFNVSRALNWNWNKTYTFYLLVWLMSSVLILCVTGIEIQLLAAHLVLALTVEWRIGRHSKLKIDYRPLKAALAVTAGAQVFWWLDWLRILCRPENHWFSGHSLWHLSGAFAYFSVYRFYQLLGWVPGAGEVAVATDLEK